MQHQHQQILENFTKFSSKFFELEPQFVNEICNRFKVQVLPKKTLLINFGQIYGHIYFVYEGMVRGYYYEDDKEITNWFAKANDFIYSPKGYLFKQPTDEAIETLSDAVVLSLSMEDVNELYNTYPEVAKMGRILTEHYLYRYDKKVRLIRQSNAEIKVKRFIEEYPKVFQDLPHKYLASYLGITAETLSRVLSKKN